MKYLILVFLLLLQGCTISVSKQNENESEPDKAVKIETDVIGDTDRFYKIIVIDQCQYIIISGYHETTICHKGNCFNPIHYK
jgi:hypothetical protein